MDHPGPWTFSSGKLVHSGFMAPENSMHSTRYTGGSLQFAHLVKSDTDRKRLGESWCGGKSLSLANIWWCDFCYIGDEADVDIRVSLSSLLPASPPFSPHSSTFHQNWSSRNILMIISNNRISLFRIQSCDSSEWCRCYWEDAAKHVKHPDVWKWIEMYKEKINWMLNPSLQ